MGSSVPLALTGLGAMDGFPEPRDGWLFIVSRAVAERSDRTDLVVPDSIVRDEDGRVVGARALARIRRSHA